MSQTPGSSKRTRKQELQPRSDFPDTPLRNPSPEPVVNKKPYQQRLENPIGRYAEAVIRLIQYAMMQEHRAVLWQNHVQAMGTREKNHSALINGDIDELIEDACASAAGFQDVLANLCTLTEIPENTGSCLSDYLKVDVGKYDVEVRAEAWLPLSQCVYGRHSKLPTFLWVNIVGEKRPVIVPTKDVVFCKGTRYDLIGFVYSVAAEFFAAAVGDDRHWKRLEDSTNMSILDMTKATSLSAVSLLYQENKMYSRNLPRTSDISLTAKDVKEINAVYDAQTTGSIKNSGLKYYTPSANESGERLLKSQRAAKLLMPHKKWADTKSNFLLTMEDNEELVKHMNSLNGPLMYSVFFNERVQTSSGLGVQGNKLCYVVGGYPTRYLCIRCLAEAVQGFLIDDRAYCRMHFPDSSVDYAVYVMCADNDKDVNYVDWNITPRGQPIRKPSERGYHADALTLQIYRSLEETLVAFHAMTIVHWLRNTLTGLPVNIRGMWPMLNFSHLNTDTITNYRGLFDLFDIRIVDGGPKNNDDVPWGRTEALKFGFILGNKLIEMKNIYAMLYEKKDESNDFVYIGKNAGKKTIVHCRNRRDDKSLVDAHVMALTPNQDMLEFLESTFALTIGVGSIFGIKMRDYAKPTVLKNYFLMAPARKPANVKLQEYIRVIFERLFNWDLQVDIGGGTSDELLRVSGAEEL